MKIRFRGVFLTQFGGALALGKEFTAETPHGVGGGSRIPDLIPVRHGQATNTCPQYRQLQESGKQLGIHRAEHAKDGN